MSLIEYLERGNWQDALKRNFELAIDALARRDYRLGSSAFDDMRTWLGSGGTNRVKMHLNSQMDICRFPPEHKAAINEALEKLIQENRDKLLSLMVNGIIKPTQEEFLTVCGLSELEFGNLINRVLAGENPFEEWMREHGCPETEIATIYQLIDDWLAKNSFNQTMQNETNT